MMRLVFTFLLLITTQIALGETLCNIVMLAKGRQMAGSEIDLILNVGPKKRQVKTILLGRTRDSETSSDIMFFWSPAEEKMYLLHSEEIQWPDHFPFPKEIQVSTQSGPTCSVFSTLNCMDYAKSAGLLGSKYGTVEWTSLERLTFYKAAMKSFPVNTGGGYISQTKAIARFFDNTGLGAEITMSVDQLDLHLDSGKPALLAYNSRKMPMQVSNVFEGVEMNSQTLTPIQPGRGGNDAHIVAVISSVNFIDPNTSELTTFYIAIDSADGMLKAIKKDRFLANGLRIILVGSKKKPSILHQILKRLSKG